MNKIFKRLTAIILCAAMLVAVAPMSAFAAEERKTVDSGFCGVDGGIVGLKSSVALFTMICKSIVNSGNSWKGR